MSQQFKEIEPPTCETCRFYKSTDPDGFGVCRRHSPVVTGPQGEAEFPITIAAGWCGDFQSLAGGNDLRSVVTAEYMQLVRDDSQGSTS